MGDNVYYYGILLEMPVGLAKDVMKILTEHVGSDRRIRRAHLVAMLRLLGAYKGKAWVRMDRMVRLAIAELQEKGYPVLSDSGRGGYWLASGPEEIEGMCREIESRDEKLQDKARALRRTGKRAWVDEKQARQMRMDV